MFYGVILIIYLLNLFFVIKIIFQSSFKIPNFHYTLLLLIIFPILTPLVHIILFLDERITKLNAPEKPIILRGNGKLFNSGHDFYADLIHEIEQAKHYILINIFIFNSDSIGKRIIRKLEEKQEEGVQVVIIYDFGARKKLKKHAFKELKNLGGTVICYMPLFVKRRINLNYRNHRKIILIDHKVAYLGGFNIGDEYLGRDHYLGPWLDIELKLTGNIKPLIHLIQKDLSKLNQSLPSSIVSLREPETYDHEIEVFQIIPSGLEKKFNSSLQTYIDLIYKAKSEIQIMTPYFIINDGLIDALLYKAHQGCKISIILPSKNDHILVNNASRAMALKLIHPNIYIYLYDPRRFMHAKVLLIDEEILFITSANLDNRSLYFNLEVGAVTKDQGLIQSMLNEFAIQKNLSKLFTKEDVSIFDQLVLLFASFL